MKSNVEYKAVCQTDSALSALHSPAPLVHVSCVCVCVCAHVCGYTCVCVCTCVCARVSRGRGRAVLLPPQGRHQQASGRWRRKHMPSSILPQHGDHSRATPPTTISCPLPLPAVPGFSYPTLKKQCQEWQYYPRLLVPRCLIIPWQLP